MPAARISSGPSASKRRCSPPAISPAQSARLCGVSSFAGALTTSRQRFAQAAATFARRAASPAPPAAGPQRTRRSMPPRRSSFVFQRPFSYGPSTVPSTIARPCSSGVRPFSSTTKATDVPPTSSVRAATLAAAVRRRSPSSSAASQPDRTDTGRRQAPVRVEKGDMALVSPKLARFDQAGEPALDEPVEALRGAREPPRGRARQRRGRRLRPLPAAPRRRRSALARRDAIGEGERAGAVPRSRDRLGVGAPDTERARERSFTLSPQSPHLPSAGEYLPSKPSSSEGFLVGIPFRTCTASTPRAWRPSRRATWPPTSPRERCRRSCPS